MDPRGGGDQSSGNERTKNEVAHRYLWEISIVVRTVRMPRPSNSRPRQSSRGRVPVFAYTGVESLSIQSCGEHCNAFVPANLGFDRASRGFGGCGPPVRFRYAAVRFRTDAADRPAVGARVVSDGPDAGDAPRDGRRRADGAREQPRHPGRKAQPADPGPRYRARERRLRADAVFEPDTAEQHVAAHRLQYRGPGTGDFNQR